MRAPLTKPAQLKHNLKLTAEFLNELGEPGAKKLGRRIWKRAVPADRVLDLLSTLKYPKDPYKTKELKAYLERRRKAGRGEIETWSVALIGLNRGKKSRPFELYGCSHDLVMQARSKDIGSPDKIGTAHGPNDFFLDLPGKEADYRPGGTWSVRLLAKARASDNPLLTLYVFDPDAEAPKGRERLFPNGGGVPVVVPAMIFPLAKIPESERKAQSNEFWSNEALPTLEGKHERRTDLGNFRICLGGLRAGRSVTGGPRWFGPRSMGCIRHGRIRLLVGKEEVFPWRELNAALEGRIVNIGERVWFEIRAPSLARPRTAGFFAELISTCPDQPQEILAFVEHLLDEWEDFFSGIRAPLSVHAQRGLYGELLVLEHLLGLKPMPIDHWTGPTGHLHDFVFERSEHRIEVKTSLRQDPVAHISEFEQLQCSSDYDLHLVLSRSGTETGAS